MHSRSHSRSVENTIRPDYFQFMILEFKLYNQMVGYCQFVSDGSRLQTPPGSPRSRKKIQCPIFGYAGCRKRL